MDPIGNDPGQKSLTFKVKILDRVIYKTYRYFNDDGVDYRFGNQRGSFDLLSLDGTNTPTVLESKALSMFETYDGSFEIDSGFGSTNFTLRSGEVLSGAEVVEVKLKRIDVNHMLVTRDDGTTYRAKGNVKIEYYSKRYEKWSSLTSSMPTQSGIFVAVGYKYRVTVRAETEDDYDSYTRVLDFTRL